jgi:hypothetical protein
MSYPAPWQSWQGNGGQQILASHADRERAVDVLKAGFTEGRLRQDELEKRVARAYAARTVGELTLLVADLPQGPTPLPAAAVPMLPRMVPAAPPAMNGKAVGSFVCGLATVVTLGATAVPALVLGHLARGEIRSRGEGGDGLAVAGLVLGWMSVAGWAMFLLFLMTLVGA